MALEALSSFEEWLEKHGAELRGAHIRLSADNPEWGLGVYTAQHEPSADDGVLCRIPLAGLALTVQTCLEDPQLGDFFGGLLAEGEGDGRLCLMLFLVVHKALGPRSAWAPYLAVLPRPRECPVPLTWTDHELQALRGTPLLAATLSMRRQLQALWDSKVQALLHAAFQRVGVSAAPSWHDWVWSHVVVWSRLLEWPAPTPDGTPDDNMQEGLLPFIDFCNHASASPVVRVAVDDAMVLVAAAPLPPATQVCISYGDKSNEELLFLYGFALPANPHDRLLLHAPPSALEPFGALPERLALLRSRGLSLRWLLPDLDEEPQAAVHSWQAALAAARVVTMPAAEAEQAAAQEERADMSPVEAPVGEVAASSDAAETAHEDAVRWLAELLKARLRALDGADEPEDVAGAGWGSLRDEDEIEKGEADGPGTGGMRAAQGVEAGSDIRAGYCDYYRASERRLCEDYLDLASQLLEPTPFVMDR